MHAPYSETCMDADPHIRTRRRILLLEQDEYLASLLHMLLYREGFFATKPLMPLMKLIFISWTV